MVLLSRDMYPWATCLKKQKSKTYVKLYVYNYFYIWKMFFTLFNIGS